MVLKFSKAGILKASTRRYSVSVILFEGPSEGPSTITLSTSDPVPTSSPTASCGDAEIGRFRIELLTDAYASETSWNLFRTPSSNNGIVGGDGDENDEVIVIGSGPEGPNVYTGDEAYTFPKGGSSFCLEKSYCYVFEIKDAYGDGICCGEGLGSYSGYLDGIKIFEGGDFKSVDTKIFCVGNSL
mmetsp:Transcript_35532/g.39948  ORF Transcript_35532/g.39948 Transcript_35532/m.39948 type:complete len:185 (+) Transcript_35532:403-957(+)